MCEKYDVVKRFTSFDKTAYYYKKNANLNLLHRDEEDGPAAINLHYSVNTECCQYFANGVSHRNNGPSYTALTNDIVIFQSWRKQGELHRLDGPAIIDNEAKTKQQWWVEGQRLSPEKEKLLNIWYANQEKQNVQ
jgi:hypothetical protein